MKALTVKQPWASLIVHGIKDIENRTWKCPKKYIGTRVLIHASKIGVKYGWRALTEAQIREASNKGLIGYKYDELPSSAIIGSAEIVDCVINHKSIWADRSLENKCPECGRKITDFKSDWHWCPDCQRKLFKGVNYDSPIYNWVLANPILFDKPIENVKGKLSFWDYDYK